MQLLGSFLARNTVPLYPTLEGAQLHGAIQPWDMPGMDALGKQRLGRDTNTLESPYPSQRKVSYCRGGHPLSSQREVTPWELGKRGQTLQLSILNFVLLVVF